MNEHTILLVEDDKLIQQIEVLLIRQCGYSVDTAMSGEEALNKVSNLSYTLILMDIGLPDKDGLSVTRTLRKLYSSTRLPIVALTAHNAKDIEVACMRAGMNAFICKPLTPYKLKCILKQFIIKQE